MEIQTIQKYMHTSPRKLRLVADMVRKMEPAKAVEVLTVTPKLASKDLEKAIKTVLANAKNQGLDASKLTFKKIEINESTKMRRFRAGTRGRVKPYKKRMSHIKIVLTDDLSSKLKVKSAKLEKANKKEGGKQTEVVMDNSAKKAKK
ncbi:50S ribosomal protein L22 [Candidatus Daviesbacteria bacterium]|nr:50S ribosomal protein L22 [Candidatus Daviesbacteria bacterium]